MKSLSLDKMALIEGGGSPCPYLYTASYSGRYCPLGFLVLFAGIKTGSYYAKKAGKSLIGALCTLTCTPPG